MFGIFPSLPQMPEVITGSFGYLTDSAGVVGNFMTWLYGDLLWGAILASLIALLLFEQLYHLLHFTIRMVGIMMLVAKLK